MPATLTIVDNLNATATATVAGTGAGDTNTLFTSLDLGAHGQTQSWVQYAQRTGDGTITISNNTPQDRFYFAYLHSTLSGGSLAVPVRFRVSRAADSILYQALGAIQARIQTLGLSPIPGDSVRALRHDEVLIGKVAFLEKRPAPCVVVYPAGSEVLDPLAGTNESDDILYPINVLIVDTDNQHLTANMRTYYKWRQDIRQAIHHTKSDLLPDPFKKIVNIAHVTPLDILDDQAWLASTARKFVSGLRVMVASRESRIFQPY